ncbi:MAG: alpha/beta hydrolase [Chloroflexota bacterium]|nr:MAG: hypothetical protein DLM70_11665 [Chloroflexota bacterium]
MSEFSLVHQSRKPTRGDGPHPALILLHGLGSNEDDMLMLAPYVDPRRYVFAARAPLPYHSSGYAWYDLVGEGPGLGGRSIDESVRSCLVGRALDGVSW